MDFDIFLHALTSYFVIIDPIGTAIVLHTLTVGQDRSYSRRMAIRAVFISTVIVLLFGFLGEQVLAGLGINIASLRVAGGLLLFYTAFGIDSPANRFRSSVLTFRLIYPCIRCPSP